MASDVDIIWEYDKIYSCWELYIDEGDVVCSDWIARIYNDYEVIIDLQKLEYPKAWPWIRMKYNTHKEAVADLEDLVRSYLSQ